MKKKITDKQKLILSKLKQHIAENGYAPSIRELAGMVGLLSSGTMHGHLRRLQEKGYIQIVGPRAIKILGKEVD